MDDADLFAELLPSTVVGTICVCIGLLFLLVQQRSLATLGLTGAWAGGGTALILLPALAEHADPEPGPLVGALATAPLAFGLASSSLYIHGLLRTAPSPEGAARLGRVAVRVGWFMAGCQVALGVVFSDAMIEDYAQGLDDPGALDSAGFWVFAGFWALVAVVYGTAWLLLAGQQLDVGERVRANSSAVAVPLLVVATAAPYRLAVWCIAAALVIMLYGLFRFHAAQGERGVFLSRFLSPQVAEQVRTEGLTSVMEPAEVELTVVACDLRGFTSYAEGVPSQAVIDLLSEYYDAVGEAVAEVDGTIKDYAGDGVLILVGAPLPRSDHAAAGLRLARRIHEVTRPVLERWATGPHPLGIGVGAASGRVTVGAIGSSGRMEYTAVGVPVNLAARLCSVAGSGETLVDGTLATATGHEDLEERDPVRLKGFGRELAVFATT